MQRRAILGWIGTLLSCLLWLASGIALAFAMRHIEQASSPPQAYSPRALHPTGSGLNLPIALGCTAFTLLQLTSFLLYAFVFRASWRLRSAVCFALAAALVMMGDAAGLLALLLWLGHTIGAA